MLQKLFTFVFIAPILVAAGCTSTDLTPDELAAGTPPSGVATAPQQRVADNNSNNSPNVNALVEEGTADPQIAQTTVLGGTSASGRVSQPVNGLSGELASLSPPQPAITPVIDTSKALSFAAVEGIPPAKLRQLSTNLSSAASGSGLTLLPAPGTRARYRITGYVSAFADGAGTRLVYVWDVKDTSGKRLHRINGQTRTSRTGIDPWMAIGQDELERVASQTTASIKRFVDARS